MNKPRKPSGSKHPAARKKRSTPPIDPATKNSIAGGYRQLEGWLRQRLEDALEDESSLPDQVTLKLEFPFNLRGRERKLAERRFTNQFELAVDEVLGHLQLKSRGYHEGHVYCYWCSAPICEHSLPADAQQVFRGYDPTGRPTWRDFASWVVEQKDDRLDRLYAKPPQPLAVACPGAQLVQDLLPEFGKKCTEYLISGQVVCGHFPLPNPDGGWGRGVALTLQLIEHRAATGEVSYSLNIVGDIPAPHHLPTLIEDRVSPVLSRFVAGLRAEVRQLAQQILEARQCGRRLPRTSYRELAWEVLKRAPGQLDKILRQQRRRTHHADDRTKNPSRPTASAFADARNASNENLFLDRQENTFIVRGPHSRIHVFNRAGVHVTSVMYSGETVQERLRTGRWGIPPTAEAELFREAIRRQVS